MTTQPKVRELQKKILMDCPGSAENRRNDAAVQKFWAERAGASAPTRHVKY
jgi:hypothetical protein